VNRLFWPLLLLLFVGSAASGAAVTDGPYVDLKTTIVPPVPENGIIITIHYPQDTYYYDPKINRIIKDRSRFWIEVHWDLAWTYAPRDVIGMGYTSWSDESRTGSAEITTIYGADPSPELAGSMSVVGFAPGDLIGVDNEEMIGASGAVYPAHASLVSTIGDLPTLLPDFDLSPFSGDPNGIVYVFQTTVPLSDMEIPEPTTMTLLGFGGAWLVCRRRKRETT
jgi:hypothetical protein